MSDEMMGGDKVQRRMPCDPDDLGTEAFKALPQAVQQAMRGVMVALGLQEGEIDAAGEVLGDADGCAWFVSPDEGRERGPAWARLPPYLECVLARVDGERVDAATVEAYVVFDRAGRWAVVENHQVGAAPSGAKWHRCEGMSWQAIRAVVRGGAQQRAKVAGARPRAWMN